MPHNNISNLSKTHGKAMFVLLMPEQGKKTHDQDQSAYLPNQKMGNEAADFINGSSRRKLWLILLVSSTCESRCKLWA